MPNESVEAELAELLRRLGTLPRAPALPDPDVLFLRAQIAACQEAAARALWTATLGRMGRYALVCAGAAWLFLDGALGSQQPGLAAWDEVIAAVSANPVNAALSLSLGAALLGAAWVVKPSFVARQLRLMGLL